MTDQAFSVRQLLRADLAAWRAHGWNRYPNSPAGTALMLFHYGGLRATFIHRLAHAANERHFHFLPSALSQLNVALHGIDLPPSVSIGPGLYMPHTVGTVINARSIGANATFQGGLTVGQKNDTGFPLIGNGVTLAAGCRVLGAITVGDGSTIGANAVVLNDVRPGALMVGIPARDARATALHPGAD